MEIIEKRLAELTPYKNNPRKNDKAVDAVAASIKSFGFKVPVVIDKKGEIVCGHTRVKAAKKLKIESVPCVVADDLTEEEIKAFRLADNKVGELAEWDNFALDVELADLDFDMTQFGFDLGDTAKDAVMQDSYTIQLPDIPNAKLGDVYRLGQNILMCGDSTSPKDVSKLMGEECAALLFTSPPYSDIREYGGDKDLSVSNIVRFIKAYEPWAKIMAVNLGMKRKDEEIVQYWDEYIMTAKACGLKLLAWNVWDKMMCGAVGQQKAIVPIRHEWIFCFGKQPVDLNLTWEKKKSSIYKKGSKRTVRQKDGTTRESTRGVTSNAWKKMESVVKIPEKETLDSVTEQFSETGKIRLKHPATFPIYLPAEYIIAFTDNSDIVVEPFGGSGTTLIACEQLKRPCRCMELDPKYVDVIIDRWEQFTGQKAEKI